MTQNQGKRTLYTEWVVGIGASAGGLEAVGTFLSHLSPDYGGAIIIAQHLAPHAKSMMVDLLKRQTDWPVIAADDHMKIEPHRIYVVPPNHDIKLQDSKIILTLADAAIRPKPSIDEFFISLAQNYGDRCVGVILSGTGTDGSKGITAIKELGGITLAQNHQSAKYDGMPNAAVDTGKIDSVLPPNMIARSLTKIITDHVNSLTQSPPDAKSFDPLIKIIQEKLNQDFRQYKPSTIHRRIAKRMRYLNVNDPVKYAEMLKTTPGEIGELAKELLISVTHFFRDPDVFEDLRPRLKNMTHGMNMNREFRVWVAGCATGEEAYTIAMLLLDIQEQTQRQFPIKIFGTDLDHDAIQEARMGIYSAKDLASVPTRLQHKYFQPHNHDTYEITKAVRDCVVFARQDLIQNPPFVKMDLISCRNVMIYFEPALQRKVLEIFHYALSPGGLLLLGKSESILSTPALFETLDKKSRIYERLNVPSPGLPATKMTKENLADMSVPVRKLPHIRPTLQEIGFRKLLKSLQISGVIIDNQLTVIQILGDITPFIKVNNLQSHLRLPLLLSKGASVEIPILVRKCEKDGKSHRSRSHQVGRGKEALVYQIVVRPLSDDDDDDKLSHGFFLVSFEPKKKSTISAIEDHHREPISTSRLSDLEQELFITKEHLQIVIEELGVSNEELQSLNEELSSTNEELQSSNEELETTNEELQSTNEELTTVNEEVSAKSNDLKTLNVNLENIQNSIGSPLIVLDSQLRLVRYNNDARKIVFLSESDISRPFLRLSTRCEIPNFEELSRNTIETGEVAETLCETDGSIYQLRITPSYDENRKIIGVILVFIDNTERIRYQERLNISEERTRAIIEASPSMICLKDSLGRYLLVNSSFKNFLNLSGNLQGRTDRELLSEETAFAFRDADLEVFMTRKPSRKEQTVKGPDGKTHHLLASRFPIMDSAGKNPISVGTIFVDITEQVEAKNELQKSERRYRAIAEDQAVFVCRHDLKGRFNYINETFANYFGISNSQLSSVGFSDIVVGGDKKQIIQSLKSITTDRPILQSETRVTKFPHENRWVRWIHRGIFGDDSTLSEIQSVGFDITEYRAQTDQLRQKEALFKGVFDNTSDYISLFKIQGDKLVLEQLNRTAEKAFSGPGIQLIGCELETFFKQTHAEIPVDKYKKVIKENSPEMFEERLNIMGAPRFFLTTIVPIPGPSGNVERVASLSRDISNYKSIENDLREAKDTADVANRAKSDFLASMSHELRTPLNVVLGFCQMLEVSTLDNEQKNLVQGIHRSGQLLLTLIEDILDLSKIEAGKIKLEKVAFSVRDFVAEIVEMFAGQAQEKGVSLSYLISPLAVHNVIGDPNRLRQVLLNFIGNALKFTSHGQVAIRVESEQTSSPDELVFKFSVTDSGIGIRNADKSKIFQKFSQAESGHARRFGGSGLGLAICKQLVQLMDGDVGFESEYGQGSVFWFKLPLTLTTQPSVLRPGFKSQPMLAPQLPTRRLRILVVDDNKESLMVAGLFLKRIGHDYVLVGSGADALKELKDEHFDLIFMDMQMPEMDGCQTSKYIRQQNLKQPIIALTANALTEDVERCFSSGMNDYLSKPVLIEDLNRMINKWAVKIEETDGKRPN